MINPELKYGLELCDIDRSLIQCQKAVAVSDAILANINERNIEERCNTNNVGCF